MSFDVRSTHDEAPNWLVWVALWIVYIVWGSTYLAIRVTVETLPPSLAGGVRFLIAGAFMFLFLLVRRGPRAMRITLREFAASAFVGIALLLGGNGLVMIAEQSVPSGLASLIIAAVPLWVVLMRRIVGDRISLGTLIGVGVGFVGVALLVLPGRPAGAPLDGVLVLLLASLSWATGSFMAGRLSMPSDPFTSTSYQMLAGGAALILFGLATGEVADVEVASFSTSSLLALAYLIVIGSWLAFTAYVWLLQNAPVSKVATYAYVNPVIALFLGWALLGETLTAMMLVGAAIIVASVAAIVRKESGRAKEPVEVPQPALVGADVSS